MHHYDFGSASFAADAQFSVEQRLGIARAGNNDKHARRVLMGGVTD